MEEVSDSMYDEVWDYSDSIELLEIYNADTGSSLILRDGGYLSMAFSYFCFMIESSYIFVYFDFVMKSSSTH
jgi:uncharacterized YccA/Bax inhibitor family protein